MFSLHQLLLLQVLTGLGPNALGGKIINGNKAPPNTLQFMVSVQVRGSHICGGFLIRDDFVLTAAHCNERNPTNVVLGTHDLRRVDHGKRIEIVERYKHPDYTIAFQGNDIMLLKLAKKAIMDNSIQTIQFSGKSARENERCFVAGWGATESSGPAVDELRMANVSVINMKRCKNEWPNLPDNVICAGGYDTDKGFCQGDSGGPLVCNNKAYGIVSFNFRGICDYPSFPNIYVDISKYHDWIKGKL